MTMGPRFQGAAGPSIGATSRATRNIGKGVAKSTITQAVPAIGAIRVLGPIRTFNWSMAWLSAYLSHRPFADAIGPERKLGIRYGGEGTVSVHTVMGAIPPRGFYTMGKFRRVKVPAFGWGIAAVPSHESRFPSSDTKGSSAPPGVARPSQGNQKGGVRPPSNGGSVPDPERSDGNPPQFQRRKGPSRTHSRSPWCSTHKTRHWCRITRRR